MRQSNVGKMILDKGLWNFLKVKVQLVTRQCIGQNIKYKLTNGLVDNHKER
jgi:hypothetical protein